MRVIITAGGTGGHIYPALAILDEIKKMEPESEFLYIGTHNRMEKDIVPKRGIKYIPIEIYGLSTSIKYMGRNIKNIFLIEKAIKKCVKLIKEFKPDVVIGVGGYVTYPVIKAAHKCGIKTFIHEQNSIPGKANKGLLKYTDLVGVSFEDSIKYIKHKNVIMTGNPVSESAQKIEKISKTKYGLTNGKKAVLIFNGSLGSSVINEKMIEYLSDADKYDYEILYITGKSYYEKFKENKFPKNVFIEPYVDNLSGLMKDFDLIVCRSGASSVAEITSIRIPAIFIPSPYVANNHQFYNAESVVKEGAGFMIEEKDLTKQVLCEKIEKILNDDKLANEVKSNLGKLEIPNSAKIIYEEIKKMI
ncbi:MAG: undecaprenyldiphospho-muramoylpentapeptide beta-N-acetylglucosaminyltransferase [Bacilli bacterium]|nr:undecaprenyldiphospho-muramoylpentapeptide beta-N-acetylglucosaminyltransferase [Bacilli bacterium]